MKVNLMKFVFIATLPDIDIGTYSNLTSKESTPLRRVHPFKNPSTTYLLCNNKTSVPTQLMNNFVHCSFVSSGLVTVCPIVLSAVKIS